MYRTIIFFVSLALASTCNAMSEAVQNAAVGGIAGTIEIAINNPLIYFKNTKQEGNVIDWKHPKVWYRGCGMNMAAMGPTTAFQTATNAALETNIPGTEPHMKITRAFLAGIASATLCAPIDLIILDQQKNNRNALRTVQHLYREAGARVFIRGWSATALREGPWSVAYLSVFPMVQELIKSKIDNPVAGHVTAYVGAGAISGTLVALGTHPIDTVKTRMQSDYKGIKNRTMYQTIRNIYATDGARGFLQGAVPRAINCGLAVPLIGTLTMYMTKKINDRNSQEIQ